MRLIILFMLMFFPIIGFANPDELPIQDFLAQVLLAVKEFGGLPWMAKISMIIMLLVGSMKVTFLRGLIWDRLGAAKAWVALILGLIAGILNLEVITLPGVLAYIGAGAGAIILHQLLDLVKALPGISPFWIMIIDLIAKVTGGKSVEQVKEEKIEKLGQ